MSPNILVTGAAGYIGGSIIAGFVAGSTTKIEKDHVFAAVRSGDQLRALETLGVNVIRLDLEDEDAVLEAVLRHKISIVIQTASAINPTLSTALIRALGMYGTNTGQETFYIHTSGLAGFCPRTGWALDQLEDLGPVFETEKGLAESFPVRATDVAVIEEAKAQGVRSFIVVGPIVYGKGTGPWNKLSIVIPHYINTCISQRTVYKFPEDTKFDAVHISDLVALYGLLVDKITNQQQIPINEEGYYFAIAHSSTWWEVLDYLSSALHARGLTKQKKVEVWPNDEFAANAFEMPGPFVQVLWNSGTTIIPKRAYEIGWKPLRTKQQFLEQIGDDIQAVIDEGKAKSSLIDSLRAASQGPSS